LLIYETLGTPCGWFLNKLRLRLFRSAHANPQLLKIICRAENVTLQPKSF
jgi:hypothetical protein